MKELPHFDNIGNHFSEILVNICPAWVEATEQYAYIL